MRPNIPPTEHYVETVAPEERAPPVTEVGPLGWLYKNLFSTWYNTLLTILSAAFIVWAVAGLTTWIVGQADWGVIVNNLRAFGTGRYPNSQVDRVGVYALILAFLAGMSWQIWGRARREVIVAIVAIVAAMFIVPPIAQTLDYPPSYILITPQRPDPVPASSFIAQKNQTVTYKLIPTTDFKTLPAGFMDNVSLTTAGQIQIDVEAAERGDVQVEERPAERQPLEVTLTLYDKDLNPLDRLTTTMQEAKSLEVTFPEETWYTLQLTSEGEEGAMWLEIDGFRPMLSATEEAERRIATYGPPPELEGTRNRVLDISYLIAFSGTRTFAQFISVYVGPFFEKLQNFVLAIAAALLGGYGATWFVRRVINNRLSSKAGAGDTSTLARLRAGIARLFSRRAAILLWFLMFPLLVLLVRGITPGEIVAIVQSLAVAAGTVTFFIVVAGLIPERYRAPIERHIILPLIAGAWGSAALLSILLLGTIFVLTVRNIFTQAVQVGILPRLILDAVGFVASPLLVVAVVATISYLMGRNFREDEHTIAGAEVVFATSILTLAMIAVFWGSSVDLSQMTVGAGLTFLLFGAVTVLAATLLYGAVAFVWSRIRRSPVPRALARTAAGLIAAALVVGVLSVALMNLFTIPQSGVIAFLEPAYAGDAFYASAGITPEMCETDDTVALLVGAGLTDYYTFRVQCGGRYTAVHYTEAEGFGIPLIEGQLSRPPAVGSGRAQAVALAAREGEVAVLWGSSTLGVFQADLPHEPVFGFALEPGTGSGDQHVIFDLAVYPLPEDTETPAEIDPDELGTPALNTSFVAGTARFTVAQTAYDAAVEPFGNSLVFVVPKWLQRTSIIQLVDVDLWGGLLLTMVLTIIGNLASFPIGVMLALGRRSDLPVVRIFCTVFIEFVRGVPLVTILFMANLIVPLLEPSLQTVPNVLRALIGMTLFNAAYIAETVRGGLQAIPRGQTEAAYALGMNALLVNVLIVLPQALRAVIPALVGQFISLFKDTSLAFIVGLIELLGVARTVITQAEYIGLQRETFLFVAVIYFVISYAMSYASWRIEESGSGAVRRL